MVVVEDLNNILSTDTTIYDVARKAECSHCAKVSNKRLQATLCLRNERG